MIWRVESTDARAEQAEALAVAVRNGEKRAVFGPGGRGKTDLLLEVVRLLGDRALLLRVPRGLDQVEAVILRAAAALGDDALREVDEALRERVDDVVPSLDVLTHRLKDRLLVVDDVDLLAAGAEHADLRDVLGNRESALEAWLYRHAVLTSREDPCERSGWTAHPLTPPEEPPLRLMNGRSQDVRAPWDRAGHNEGHFRLILTLAMIEGGIPEPGGREESLLGQIWSGLHERHRAVLQLLAVHERPLSLDVLRALPSPPSESALSAVQALPVVGSDGRLVWLEGPLQRFSRAKLQSEEASDMHLALAATFAGELHGDETNAWLKARELQEAHRHYVEGGQIERAMRLARHGVHLLLDLARQRSSRARGPQDYAFAESLYEAVLSQGEARIGRRAYAYAKHYLHYNRYKSKPDLAEPLSETESGYRESIEKWPENGLFWSRLALTQFLRGERHRAVATLDEAREKVPQHMAVRHTGKDWLLRARVVQRLLHYEPPHVIDALIVWGAYSPKDSREQEVRRDLEAVFSRGWRTKLLDPPGVSRVVLHREIAVRIVRAGAQFACSLGDLRTARGGDPLSALVEAVRKLRDRVDELRKALTHTLDADSRAQKQRLLGAVDIVASRLLGTVPETTWILGKVEIDHDVARVREVGAHGGLFELDPSVEPPRLPDSLPRLVRVRTGAAGEPEGPVVGMDEPLGRDPERLWEEWRKRMNETDRG